MRARRGPSRWSPEPGPQARQLAELYCPCGAVRGVGNVVCPTCFGLAPQETLAVFYDRRTRKTGIRLLLEFAAQRRAKSLQTATKVKGLS